MTLQDTFTITRHLDVPPGEVFAAFADTAVRRRWFRSPGSGATHELDFRVGGGESTSSTFTAQDAAPERLEYRSWFLDIVDAQRIVHGYEAVVDGEVRWTSLVTIQLAAEAAGTRLQWTEQVTFLRYAGDGSVDLAHLRGGTALQLNGLDAALTSVPRRYPISALPRTEQSECQNKIDVVDIEPEKTLLES